MNLIHNYMERAAYEHRFWLQILGDHSRFILSALSPKEERRIQQARTFINVFDQLLTKARVLPVEEEISLINQEAYDYATSLRQFKLSLLQAHLVQEVQIDLTPTFLNHMVNEIDEYLEILCILLRGCIPSAHPLHHHLLWLLDGVGHANAIKTSLDSVEKDLIKKSKKFEKIFQGLFTKSIEMTGYLRTNVLHFPALFRLNTQAENSMTLFQEFLKELEKLRLRKEALGTTSPLLLDHMFREECYYLTKLSIQSNITKPCCDGTEPRLHVKS